MLIDLQELKNIFFDLAQIELSDQEMMMLSDYMKEHITKNTNRTAINRSELEELLTTQYPRVFDEEEASYYLQDLK